MKVTELSNQIPAIKTPADWKQLLEQFANDLPEFIELASTDFSQQLVAGCVAQAYVGIRPASLQFLLQLHQYPDQPMLVDIAQNCGLSKQAASQIAAEVEEHGYLRRKANLTDRRTKRLLLTPKGHKLIGCAEEVALGIMRSYAAKVGATEMASFKKDIGRLYRAFVSSGSNRQAVGGSDTALALHLAGLTSYSKHRLIDSNKALGFGSLKMSFSPVLMHMSPHGTRFSDLVLVNRDVSKQAISQLVKEIEQLGFVERREHPVDGRSSVLFLTESGVRLIYHSLRSLAEIDAEFSQVLGSKERARLAHTAKRLFGGLERRPLIVEGSSTAASTDAALRDALTYLFEKCDESLRSRLFKRDGATATLSPTAMKILGALPIDVHNN